MQSQPIVNPVTIKPWRIIALSLPGLVALADLLIWQAGTPRLSLAVFVVAVVGAAQLLAGPGIGRRATLFGWGGVVLGGLAVVEEVQTLSVLILILGMTHAVAWFAAGSDATWAVIVRAGWRWFGQAILRSVADLWKFGQGLVSARIGRAGLAHLMRDWALPLGLGGLFVLLFISANPVLDTWALAVSNWSPDIRLNLWRVLFWLVIAGLVWPLLRLPAMRPRLLTPAKAPTKARSAVHLPEAVLNPRSVVRALLTFNLIFALQTGLDLTYLWGGVGLPDGMTHAIYAHRGAYPLVVTALLAGGFALITQPFLRGQPLLRGLMFLWTAQNILLVVSSILRLDLYVDAYGLTRLRFAAFIWMGLVVAGLVLMVWQVACEKPVRWLFARAGLLGLSAVYVCSFINVAGLVARHNLARSNQDFDHYYLCTLGPGAVVAIARAERATGTDYCFSDDPLFVKAPQDLREWGYRNYRLRNSLAALAASPLVQPEVRTQP